MSTAIATGITTIVGGSDFLASTTILGNGAEQVSRNVMIQLAAKTLQATTSAFLCIWATFNIAFALGVDIYQYADALAFTSMGTAIAALSIPAVTQIAKWGASPKTMRTIKEFEKNYSTTIKTLNFSTALFACGWLTTCAILTAGSGGGSLILSILLSGGSAATSAYHLFK